MHKILLFVFVLSLYACSFNHQSEQEESKFFTLRTPASLLDIQKELKLSELSDSVWYIPLETNDSSLLGNIFLEGSIQYVSGKFYIYDGQQNTIYVFSSNGKFLNKISKKGQADGEILYFLDYTTDGELVYIADFGNKMHRFKNDGTYLGNAILPKQAYRLINLDKDRIACFVTDDQFTDVDSCYSWLIVNFMGDSITYNKTPTVRELKKNDNINYYVLHNFSTDHPFAYKEPFNDSLYHFTPEGKISSYAFIDFGMHKINPSMTFDEMIKQKHTMRFTKVYDTSTHLISRCNCACMKDVSHWFTWNKSTGDFFQIQDSEGEENITNDLGGPNFKPFGCAYPSILIGISEAMNCSDEFSKKYNIKPDDNPVLVMTKCKSQK